MLVSVTAILALAGGSFAAYNFPRFRNFNVRAPMNQFGPFGGQMPFFGGQFGGRFGPNPGFQGGFGGPMNGMGPQGIKGNDEGGAVSPTMKAVLLFAVLISLNKCENVNVDNQQVQEMGEDAEHCPYGRLPGGKCRFGRVSRIVRVKRIAPATGHGRSGGASPYGGDGFGDERGMQSMVPANADCGQERIGATPEIMAETVTVTSTCTTTCTVVSTKMDTVVEKSIHTKTVYDMIVSRSTVTSPVYYTVAQTVASPVYYTVSQTVASPVYYTVSKTIASPVYYTVSKTIASPVYYTVSKTIASPVYYTVSKTVASPIYYAVTHTCTVTSVMTLQCEAADVCATPQDSDMIPTMDMGPSKEKEDCEAPETDASSRRTGDAGCPVKGPGETCECNSTTNNSAGSESCSD